MFGSGDSDEIEKKLQESIRKAKERRRSQHDQSSSSNYRNTDPDAHHIDSLDNFVDADDDNDAMRVGKFTDSPANKLKEETTAKKRERYFKSLMHKKSV